MEDDGARADGLTVGKRVPFAVYTPLDARLVSTREARDAA